jgi:hypothetical protein
MQKSWLLRYPLLILLANREASAYGPEAKGAAGGAFSVAIENPTLRTPSSDKAVISETIEVRTGPNGRPGGVTDAISMPREREAPVLPTPQPTIAPLQGRQDDGQIQALSAQLQSLSQSATQAISSVSSSASSAISQISQSAQSVRQSADQAVQSANQAANQANRQLTQTQSSASSAVSAANSRASDQLSQSLSSMSSRISANLASAQSSASSAISSAQVVASQFAASQIQAAKAEASSVRAGLLLLSVKNRVLISKLTGWCKRICGPRKVELNIGLYCGYYRYSINCRHGHTKCPFHLPIAAL